MSKSVKISVEDGESEKSKASANLINTITLLIVALVVGAILFFVIKLLSPIVIFILQLVLFLLFLLCIYISLKKNNKRFEEYAKNEKTYREFAHEIMKEKLVSESSQEEKEDVLQSFSLLTLLGTALLSFLWIAPLIFGLSSKYQIFPLNILAIISTIIGFVLWRDSVLSFSKMKRESIDEKVSPPNKWESIKSKLGAIPLGIYALCIFVYTITDAYGIDLTLLANMFNQSPK